MEKKNTHPRLHSQLGLNVFGSLRPTRACKHGRTRGWAMSESGEALQLLDLYAW